MGQQQLILLVLATVIVGTAIVVGIAAFSENSAKANADAIVQDAVRIANDAQSWKRKPAPFGGQASSEDASVVNDPRDYTGATLGALGYPGEDTYSNLNGNFEVVGASSAGFFLQATNDPNATGDSTIVSLAVCGLTDGDIISRIVQIAGVSTGLQTAACP